MGRNNRIRNKNRVDYRIIEISDGGGQAGFAAEFKAPEWDGWKLLLWGFQTVADVRKAAREKLKLMMKDKP